MKYLFSTRRYEIAISVLTCYFLWGTLLSWALSTFDRRGSWKSHLDGECGVFHLFVSSRVKYREIFLESTTINVFTNIQEIPCCLPDRDTPLWADALPRIVAFFRYGLSVWDGVVVIDGEAYTFRDVIRLFVVSDPVQWYCTTFPSQCSR